MISSTSFNEKFRSKVRAAMRQAVVNAAAWGTKGQAYVTNRRGRVVLRVDFDPEHHPHFRIWAGMQRDISTLAVGQIKTL